MSQLLKYRHITHNLGSECKRLITSVTRHGLLESCTNAAHDPRRDRPPHVAKFPGGRRSSAAPFACASASRPTEWTCHRGRLSNPTGEPPTTRSPRPPRSLVRKH